MVGRFLKQRITAWLRDTSGATAIEYALIAAGVSLALIVFIFSFGQSIGDVFIQMSSILDI